VDSIDEPIPHHRHHRLGAQDPLGQIRQSSYHVVDTGNMSNADIKCDDHYKHEACAQQQGTVRNR
jgi:hypothetical protein